MVVHMTWDHPRIRGEHVYHYVPVAGREGSSPHTRGAPRRRPARRRCPGIIPAYAGSTPGSSTIGAGSRDHPRIRGEHCALRRTSRIGLGIIPAYAGSTCAERSAPILMTDHPRIRGEHNRQPPGRRPTPGSSPHTRGARHERPRGRRHRRIIPAYAGSTWCRWCAIRPVRDHPRIRGEHPPPVQVASSW